ncbi:MAG TPA: hybrid sensor histidine kinase/response regulator, partial [Terriglobia bacterium]|nr:hybrid sensor histidine kinase/response regulator [Terriglobia bacterium]
RGKLRLNFRSVELALVIEAALDSVRPMAALKEIDLECQLDCPAGTILGDPDRLQQMIWNLLSNAIKFTPPSGRVAVRLQRVQSHLQVSVSDTGKGVDPEFLPYVFERFRQGASGITRSHGGLGLGLSIVRHLVELHGGTARAESLGEGHGSTFILDFPIRAVNLKTDEEPSATPSPAHNLQQLKGVRVMVVDDEADARDLITVVMQQHGAEVSVAASAAAAIESLDKNLPDILLCDIGMPKEDGYSLIARLRARTPEQGGQLPAIALTAFNAPKDRERLLQAGFHMHVPKPVEPTDLVDSIARLTGHYSARAHRRQF